MPHKNPAVARAVIARDKKCVDCGSKVNLQAAHRDDVQDPKHALYEKVEGAQARCVSCHILQHERLLANSVSEADRHKHMGALQLLRADASKKAGLQAYHNKRRANLRLGRDLRALSQMNFWRRLEGLPDKEDL